MTSDRYQIIHDLDLAISSQNQSLNHTQLKNLLSQLREKSKIHSFLIDFDELEFQSLISNILIKLDNDLVDQLDVIATIANIIYTNEKLRNSQNLETQHALKSAITYLFESLDYVSERSFNSEAQYKDYLPIFRLYFLLCQNTQLIPDLRTSIVKISGKLLNFITLSSSDSSNLNTIIIEILKILYAFIHQLEDTSGIDSSYVLSCNKFQLLYGKEMNPSKEYDEILQHLGNVLLTIPTEVSQNYMLNKLKFAQNEVTFINKVTSLSRSGNTNPLSNAPTTNILTLTVLVTIDQEDTGVRSYIAENLNFESLSKYPSSDPNLSVVISQLRSLLDAGSQEKTPDSESSIPKFNRDSTSTTTAVTAIDPISSVSNNSSSSYSHRLNNILNDAIANKPNNDNVPKFEDLTEEEQDLEIEKMAELFDKIEKNGVFSMKMK